MKKFKTYRIASLSLIALMMIFTATPMMSIAAQSTVNLGTTSSYAVLAGSTITNTGTTIIKGSAGGDVGLYPGTEFTGITSTTIDGSVHLADTQAIQAQKDLVAAYNDAAGRTPVTRIATELGGMILTPGVYDSADGTFQITGTLALDAQGDPDGVFVFKTSSSLITAPDSNIILLNGARYCRTFWQVGSSATLGTNSHFVGHIFALTSITANAGASVQGQLLARNGAVTLDSNTIINGICDATTPPVGTEKATLNVIKHVINNDEGKSVAADFNLHVKMNGVDVAASPASGKESPGTTYTLAPGTYTISEDLESGYDSSISGDGNSRGIITLAANDDKTIIITNNDIETGTSPVVLVPVDTTPIAAPVVTTATGGELPSTASSIYLILWAGIILTTMGYVGLANKKKNEL